MKEYNSVFEGMIKSLNEGKNLDETVNEYAHHFEEIGAGYMSIAYHFSEYLQNKYID